MPCDTATVTVGSTGGGTASIVVDNVLIKSNEPFIGSTVEVEVSVSNTGDSYGEKTFDLMVNSRKAAEFVASLESGASKTKVVEVQVPDSSSLTVSVGGKSDTATTTPSDGDGGTQNPDIFSQVTKFVEENPYKTAAGLGVVGLSLMMSGDDERPVFMNRRRGR